MTADIVKARMRDAYHARVLQAQVKPDLFCKFYLPATEHTSECMCAVGAALGPVNAKAVQDHDNIDERQGLAMSLLGVSGDDSIEIARIQGAHDTWCIAASYSKDTKHVAKLEQVFVEMLS